MASKIILDEAHRRFTAADVGGTRVKEVRDRTLHPGGRVDLTLFEKAEDEGRAHPRLTTSMPPATDPSPPAKLFAAPRKAPDSLAAFEKALADALEKARPTLAGEDLDATKAPKGSEKFWRNSLRAQRVTRFFDEARAALGRWEAKLPAADRDPARCALAAAEAEAHSGVHQFDDSDTGTYHSFQHDAPFVHYLESILKSLPEAGTPGFLVLAPEQQESIRRQRQQIRNHLDHLMRHKYAYEVIDEMNIEHTLGGMLIDRETRHIASERLETADSLQPAYELLRVQPGTRRKHAGEYVYRDEDGKFRLKDGTLTRVAAADVRSIPVEVDRLTFERAPKDARLRKNVRFDWDGNGYVQHGLVDWVSWAGHCDIKAIMEQLGVTLADGPSLTEYRTDAGTTQTYNRDLLLEMIASVFELGSSYVRADGSGDIERGVHLFGGARNDSRPDRLQFKGTSAGQSFRWPLTGRQDAFVIESLEWADGTKADMGSVFHRYLPDVDKLDFAPNPRYLTTVEGDYNVIDVSGALLQVKARCPEIDPSTGYLREKTRTLEIDLRPSAAGQRIDLGTHVDDAAQRRIYRVYLDRKKNTIVAELDQYERVDGKYVAKNLAGETVTLPMVKPLNVTLSREMPLDDPAAFQALIEIALRQAQNINADTDMKAPVWNGTVTRIDARRQGINRDTRVERWSIELQARFGSAKLDYLLRRKPQGDPDTYCPVTRSNWEKAPDFLWQDFPDIGSKGMEDGDWVINRSMVERGIVSVENAPEAPGGIYVHDDHIKNVYEMIYCALGGLPYSVVHGNKRYGFADEASWKKAVDRLKKLRDKVSYQDGEKKTQLGEVAPA